MTNQLNVFSLARIPYANRKIHGSANNKPIDEKNEPDGECSDRAIPYCQISFSN